MKSRFISCIVPVFNGEKYLEEALESIFKQTYRPQEVIVADDGSTDATSAIVARYRDQIRYFRQNSAGAPTARNLGLSMAQGEFVAFLDCDDVWHAEKLERQIARFENRPELEVCVTHVQNFWMPELAEEADHFRNHRLTQAVPGYVTATLLARRSLFDRVGMFNATLQHGDAQEWFLRAAEQGAVMDLLPDVLLYRRLHRTNFSRQVSATLDDHLRIIKASLDRRRRGQTTVRAYEFPDSDLRKREKSATFPK